MAAKKAPPITKEPEGAPMPTRIALTCQFGYYDDAGTMRMWQAGHVITDQDEIADLIARGAEHIDQTPE